MLSPSDLDPKSLDPIAALHDGSLELRDQVRARIIAPGGLYFFNKAIIGFADLSPRAHLPLCLFLEDKTRPHKLVEYPRRHLKSSCATEGFPLWLFACDAIRGEDLLRRVGIGSATKTNAMRFWRYIKITLETNTLVQTFVPEIIPEFSNEEVWNKEEGTLPRNKIFPDPSFDTIGAGGQATSRHYTTFLEDDLVNEDNWDSPGAIARAVEQHQLFANLLERENDIHITVENSWSTFDLNNHIVRNEPDTAVFSVGGTKLLNRHRSRHLPPAVQEMCDAWEQPDKDGKRMALWPERFDLDALARLRKKEGARIYCTPGDAPVLMHDLETKRIDEVRVGDAVLAFEESRPGKGCHRGMRLAAVTAVHSMRAPVVEFVLASGKRVRSTVDHPWYRVRSKRSDVEAGGVRVGDALVPWIELEPMPSLNEAQRRAAAWLAGIYDGEGHTHNGRVYFSQHLVKNAEVCRGIEYALDLLGFRWGKSDGRCGVAIRTYFLLGGKQEVRRFVLLTKPTKWRRIVEKGLLCRKADCVGVDEVVAIHPLGEQLVYSLETTEKTYTVWGFLSHNSAQYENDPYDADVVDFKEEWLKYFDINARGDLALGGHGYGSEGTVMRESLNIVASFDPALGKKRENARSAFLVVGIDPQERIFLMSEWAVRDDPLKVLDGIFERTRRWEAQRCAVEAVLFQRVLADLLSKRCRDWNAAPGRRPQDMLFPGLFQAVQLPKGKTKEGRIRALIGSVAEAGRLYVNRSCVEFLDEYSRFPEGETVDLLDAFTNSAELWRPGVDVAETEAETKAELAWLAQRDPVTGY
jgi:hypothetical protein